MHFIIVLFNPLWETQMLNPVLQADNYFPPGHSLTPHYTILQVMQSTDLTSIVQLEGEGGGGGVSFKIS